MSQRRRVGRGRLRRAQISSRAGRRAARFGHWGHAIECLAIPCVADALNRIGRRRASAFVAKQSFGAARRHDRGVADAIVRRTPTQDGGKTKANVRIAAADARGRPIRGVWRTGCFA